MSKPTLKLDWCSRKAARYACLNWHYSRTYPVAKSVNVGVWENNHFIGAIVFTCGSGAATKGQAFGLAPQFEVVELQRVALTTHQTPVTRMIAIAIRMLKRLCPKLKLLVSYADPVQDHHGGIYQAGNWTYLGTTAPSVQVELSDGRWVHKRTTAKHWGKHEKAHFLQTGRTKRIPGKHKYAYPLVPELIPVLERMKKEPPRRARSSESGTPRIQRGRAGAIPSRALSNSRPRANKRRITRTRQLKVLV